MKPNIHMSRKDINKDKLIFQMLSLIERSPNGKEIYKEMKKHFKFKSLEELKTKQISGLISYVKERV